jgi:hypothetical protein
VLDQAQEIVPQCRFWLFSHWIHSWTNDPCFARDVSANAKLGPQPVFVNGNHMAAKRRPSSVVPQCGTEGGQKAQTR